MGKLLEAYGYWGDVKERKQAIAANPELREHVEVLELFSEQSQLRFAGRPAGYPTLDYRERGDDFRASKTAWNAARRYRESL
jgi:hypothetical protein